PGLDGMNLHIVTLPAGIQHHLRGLANAVQGHPGVAGRVKSKPGHGVEFEQKRAHHPEEVTDHSVSGPGVEQFAQAVADIECTTTMLFDQMPDTAGKAFEAAEGIDCDGSNRGVLLDNGRVFAEAKVDYLPAGFSGSIHKRKDEAAIIIEVGYPPDNVIADSKAIKNLVQSGQPGGNPV